MKRSFIFIALFVTACGSKPEVTAEQRWYYAPEWCHKVLIATGPVSVAPKDWAPSSNVKAALYRAGMTDPSKDYVASQCGAYPGHKS